LNQQNSPLEQAWFAWIKAQLPPEFKVVFAEELAGKDGPRPQKPFVTLKLISGPRPYGHDDLRASPAGFKKVGHRGYTLSVIGYGMEAHAALSELQTRLGDSCALRSLGRAEEVGIGVAARGDVLDVSGQLETGYERRHQIDVMFNSATELATADAAIESARVSGTLEQGAQGNQDVGPIVIDGNLEP
jgi:hypothetical protein